MLKINNALIIDDQINLITDDENSDSINNDDYKSLRNIKNYFLNNSIPVSIINDLGSYPLEALNKIPTLSRPDIVVMDLDLNSDQIIGDDDINLIGLTLDKLYSTFGDFILFIYSSQSDEWENIMPQILESHKSLHNILEKENTIVFEKFIEITEKNKEDLAVEISQKRDRFYKIILSKVDVFFKNLWNKEVLAIGFLLCVFSIIIRFSFINSDNNIFIITLIIIALVSYKYSISSKKL